MVWWLSASVDVASLPRLVYVIETPGVIGAERSGGVYFGRVTDTGRLSASYAVVVTFPFGSDVSTLAPNVSYPMTLIGRVGTGVSPLVSVLTVGAVVTAIRPTSS